ncbi:hypothetical protein B0T25DRAFT_355425 [Lasiosphaeria hispida]|uniref:Uncharacterized protein n=1 Tax=Lasiosphaeria hispida TaxID=260671 RepID=A0AAJ0H787_9PEZI|nr:hypothetical protein B0T25DRAFT_355425 [Lasiosphaeria hispida]
MSYPSASAGSAPCAARVFSLALRALLAALVLSELVAGTCYRLDGLPYSKIRTDDGDWVPCNSDARISHCCSSKDYCLPNGLCLDAGANNYFSIQGCTDPSWPAPCVKSPQCQANIRDEYSFIFPCRQATNASFYHCCGETAECCGTTKTEDFLSFEGVTEIYRPSVLPASATPTPTPSESPSPDGTSSSSTKILAIGLGVGGALALAIIAALIFFGCRLHQHQTKRNEKDSSTINLHASSPAPISPIGGDKSRISATTTYSQPPHQQQQQQQMYVPNPSPGSPFQSGGGPFIPSASSTPVQAYSFNAHSPPPMAPPAPGSGSMYHVQPAYSGHSGAGAGYGGHGEGQHGGHGGYQQGAHHAPPGHVHELQN